MMFKLYVQDCSEIRIFVKKKIKFKFYGKSDFEWN